MKRPVVRKLRAPNADFSTKSLARVPKPRRREESTLLADIRRTFGARPDVLLVRINTGVFAAPSSPKTRIRSAPNGFPDLHLVQRRRVMVRHRTETNFSAYEEDRWHEYGQAIYIETKTKDGRMSKDQLAFRQQARAVGALYLLARSVEDVEAVLGIVPEWVK